MEHPIHLAIGSLHISFSVPDVRWRAFVAHRYAPYLAGAPLRGGLRVDIAGGPVPRHNALTVSRDRSGWRIDREDFVSRSSSDFAVTDLHVLRDRYSFDSWLRVFCTLCGAGDGRLLMHSAAHHDAGGIYLFPGRSGSGKSTITRLLGKGSALSDELVLVSRGGDGIRASSTPFWGELRKGTGTVFDAPVRGIFFLRHGTQLSARRLPPPETLRRLMTTVLFFSDEPEAVGRILDSGAALAESLPAFELSFTLRDTRDDVLACVRTALARQEDIHAL
jgi:hypothetical protein